MIEYIDRLCDKEFTKDMCDRVVTNIRTSGGIISEFSITIGLH